MAKKTPCSQRLQVTEPLVWETLISSPTRGQGSRALLQGKGQRPMSADDRRAWVVEEVLRKMRAEGENRNAKSPQPEGKEALRRGRREGSDVAEDGHGDVVEFFGDFGHGLKHLLHFLHIFLEFHHASGVFVECADIGSCDLVLETLELVHGTLLGAHDVVSEVTRGVDGVGHLGELAHVCCATEAACATCTTGLTATHETLEGLHGLVQHTEDVATAEHFADTTEKTTDTTTCAACAATTEKTTEEAACATAATETTEKLTGHGHH